MDLRIGQVSVPCPRLNVQLIPRADVVPADIVMLIRRVGESADYASYEPIQVVGNIATFQFDDLLFDTAYGRFDGTLTYMGNKYASLQFQFVADPSINPALQLSTIGPYRKPREFGNPDYSGTGIAGPGTLIGLKDSLRKTYNGASGYKVVVRTDEKGFDFAPDTSGSGGITGVQAGTGIAVDNTDPQRPIVSATGGGSGGIASVVAGVNIVVDNSDPTRPLVAGILQVHAANAIPAAPDTNGILAMYTGSTTMGTDPGGNGIVFSCNGEWIDIFSYDVLTP